MPGKSPPGIKGTIALSGEKFPFLYSTFIHSIVIQIPSF